MKASQNKFGQYLIKKNAPSKPTQEMHKSATKLNPSQNLEKSYHFQSQKKFINIPQNYHPKGSAGGQQSNILEYIPLKNSRKPLGEQGNQPERQKREQHEMIECGPQLVLIGPFDLIDSDEQYLGLEQLAANCSKQSIIQWIKQKNRGRDEPKDYRNIHQINNQKFWCQDIQKIITLILREYKKDIPYIPMLPALNQTQKIVLTRKQIFILIASMFLCIIPPQMNNKLVSFIDLMTTRSMDDVHKQKPIIRLEKLKCVINYLQYMCDVEDIYDQQVTFQRIYESNSFKSSAMDNPLSRVVIQKSKIQSGYTSGIIIDFANANVGGGFLTNGSAQEEILFSIFPQMIITKLLCEPLKNEEAIIVSGARRVNIYEGYSHEFRFKGTYRGGHPSKSCIVAVDAIDYTKGSMKSQMQYYSKPIKRELNKIHLGVKAAVLQLELPHRIYTGRWGCGVFGADQYLKFCIQWIACSQAKAEMHFFTDEEQKLINLSLLAEELREYTARQLLDLIEKYGHQRQQDNEKGFIEYLKYYV